MQARCRIALFFFVLPFLFPAAGCRNNTGKLENEVRTRDQLYREALEEQLRMESQNLALRREIDALRQSEKSPAATGGPSSYGVKRIVLGRATGGLDQDKTPGEEILQIVMEPRDSEDHSFKAPGLMQIYALEVPPTGVKTPLCMWEISPDKLEPTWKSGLLSVGYTLTLPWKVLPVHENVRIIVRFTTPDQRIFEADRDIRVRLVPGALQKRPELAPETLPLPGPVPVFESGPILVPTSQTSSWRRTLDAPPAWPTPAPAATLPSTTTQTQWRPVSPGGSVTIGRPQPLEVD